MILKERPDYDYTSMAEWLREFRKPLMTMGSNKRPDCHLFEAYGDGRLVVEDSHGLTRYCHLVEGPDGLGRQGDLAMYRQFNEYEERFAMGDIRALAWLMGQPWSEACQYLDGKRQIILWMCTECCEYIEDGTEFLHRDHCACGGSNWDDSDLFCEDRRLRHNLFDGIWSEVRLNMHTEFANRLKPVLCGGCGHQGYLSEFSVLER